MAYYPVTLVDHIITLKERMKIDKKEEGGDEKVMWNEVDAVKCYGGSIRKR